jgi:hypothetical protein
MCVSCLYQAGGVDSSEHPFFLKDEYFEINWFVHVIVLQFDYVKKIP